MVISSRGDAYPVSYALFDGRRARRRKRVFLELVQKARLGYDDKTGEIVVRTLRASRRARGIGIIPHSYPSKRIRRRLVGAGIPEDVAFRVTWRAKPLL